MANNAYLLRDTASGEALLIDAAAEPGALRSLIGDADLRTVVTTHGHWDHHRALPDVVQATGAVTVAHAADAADLPVPVQRTVGHGDRDRRRTRFMAAALATSPWPATTWTARRRVLRAHAPAGVGERVACPGSCSICRHTPP